MRGDRFGTVVKVGKRTLAVYVKMDRSGRTLRFMEHNLQRKGASHVAECQDPAIRLSAPLRA